MSQWKLTVHLQFSTQTFYFTTIIKILFCFNLCVRCGGICVHVCMSVCMNVICISGPEEGIRSPGAGITSSV